MSTYTTQAEIGRGGMAVVYSGWDERLDRPVALKVLAAHLADDPDFQRRFLREAKLAARLHHPNIVRTYDITETDGRPTIVMELLAGGTLERGRLSHEEAVGVADGLAHAHGHGIVHRDLKPANLLRAIDGSVKIADFGVARAVEETMVTQVGTVLGTLRYLAPEQARGEPVGPAADVYSLGVVLAELVERQPPDLRLLLGRCRADEPHARPTAAEVASALRGETLASPTRVAPSRSARRHRRVRLLPALLALGALAAIIAAAAIALTRTSGSSQPTHVQPVPKSADANRQARNLAAWLEQYSR
jgi:serine/threonine-protein kinase